MIKPKDTKRPFTEDDEDTLKSLEPKVDEQIRTDLDGGSRQSEIDMFHPFRLENGDIISEHIWEKLMENYAKEGWNVTRIGRVFTLRP